jgi:hypothetical protein
MRFSVTSHLRRIRCAIAGFLLLTKSCLARLPAESLSLARNGILVILLVPAIVAIPDISQAQSNPSNPFFWDTNGRGGACQAIYSGPTAADAWNAWNACAENPASWSSGITGFQNTLLYCNVINVTTSTSFGDTQCTYHNLTTYVGGITPNSTNYDQPIIQCPLQSAFIPPWGHDKLGGYCQYVIQLCGWEPVEFERPVGLGRGRDVLRPWSWIGWRMRLRRIEKQHFAKVRFAVGRIARV